MKLIQISAGQSHSDGGAYFGVIPKALWNKVYPSDELNLIKIASRCLLIDCGERKILIEAGPGNHYSEKFLNNHGMISGNHIEDSLYREGYSTVEITDVLFTHLHWDHFNGAIKNVGGQLNLTFPNASYWCSKTQWDYAKVSNIREKIAFYDGLLDFVINTGKLKLVENEGLLFPNIDVRFFNGHTPGQMIPLIHYNNQTIVFSSDLIPFASNIPVVWLASYDLFPVTVMEEKEIFLNEIWQNNYILFLHHDYYYECATIKFDGKGYSVFKSGSMNNFIDT